MKTSSEIIVPDVNVWLALVHPDHPHHEVVLDWWGTSDWIQAGFIRFTQIALLRLLSTAIVMHDSPLTMMEAWAVYEALFRDNRIRFLAEPEGVQNRFRKLTAMHTKSPKLWADLWLVAFAETSGATLVTCDKALAKQSKHTHLLLSSK